LEIKSWIKKTEIGHYIRCSSLAGSWMPLEWVMAL
jgi:hypothetical protein